MRPELTGRRDGPPLPPDADTRECLASLAGDEVALAFAQLVPDVLSRMSEGALLVRLALPAFSPPITGAPFAAQLPYLGPYSLETGMVVDAQLGAALAIGILGLEPGEVTEELIGETLMEILNVVAGQVKHAVPLLLARSLVLGLPTRGALDAQAQVAIVGPSGHGSLTFRSPKLG